LSSAGVFFYAHTWGSNTLISGTEIAKNIPMGAFFTNIQLFTGTADKTIMHAKIRETLLQYIPSLGFTQVSTAGDADLSVALSPVGEKPWLGVYDQGTEDQDPKKLSALLTTLTGALSCAGVGITVHDSDVLHMVLFENGRPVDSHNSNPAYFGEKLSKTEIKERQGHAEKWRTVIKAGYTPENLRQLFAKEKPVLAEEALISGFAGLFDWNREYCAVGYHYLQDIDTEGFVTLRFRLNNKAQTEEQCTGSPVFQIQSHNLGLSGVVNFGFNYHFSFSNRGGETKGIRLVLWGPALERELINGEGLIAEIRRGSRKSDETRAGSFTKAHSAAGERLLVWELPGYSVVAGMKKDPYSFDYGQMRSQMERFYDTHSNVVLKGCFAGPGKETLYAGCVPLENPEEGSTSLTIPVDVIGSPCLPLHCAVPEDGADSFAVQTALRQLSVQRSLCGMAIIPLLEDDTAVMVRTLAAQWLALLQENYTGTAEGFMIQRNQQQKYKTGRISKKKKLGGKSWEAALQAVITDVNLFVSLPTHNQNEHYSPDIRETLINSGLLICRRPGTQPFWENDIPPAVHLCFWLDLHAVPENTHKRAADLLDDFMGGVMSAGGLQAFVTRWDFSPFSAEIYTTPYETACGIPADGKALSSGWCGSYLRMMAEKIWLSAGLAQKIATFAEVKKYAEVIEGKGFMQISLKPESSSSDLEQSLGAILPSKTRFAAMFGGL